MANLFSAIWDRVTNRDQLKGLVPDSAVRVGDKVEKNRIRSDDYDPEEALTTVSVAQSFERLWEDLKLSRSRYENGLAGWRAYVADSRISAQIDGIGDHATTANNEGKVFWLELQMEDEGKIPARVQNAFDRMEERVWKLRLEAKAPQITKRALIEGDCFCEVVVSERRNSIVDFREIPGAREGKMMEKRVNDQGTCVAWVLYDMRTGETDRYFEAWQVIQFSWNKFQHYGHSLLTSSKLDFERILQMEESMYRAREERAYVKFAHIFEGFDETQLQRVRRYLSRVRKTRARGVETDIVSNKEVKMLDPSNAQLAHIPDVEHVQRKILTSGRMPMGFLGGFGEDINRAVLEKQEEGLIRFLSKVNAMLSDGFRELLELQLILDNVLVEEVPFSILWTEKKVDNFKETAEALGILVEKLKISPQSAMAELGFDSEQELQRWEEWEKRMNEIARNTEDREGVEIDALMKAIQGNMNGSGKAESVRGNIGAWRF